MSAEGEIVSVNADIDLLGSIRQLMYTIQRFYCSASRLFTEHLTFLFGCAHLPSSLFSTGDEMRISLGCSKTFNLSAE
jgi:hypothetical protein